MSLVDNGAIMNDALASMLELAEKARAEKPYVLHARMRELVRDRFEHAALMLVAAACLIDPDERVSVLADRLADVISEQVQA